MEAHIIFESENVIALLDIDSINEGNVPVIPKLHESSIDKRPIRVLTEIFETAQRIKNAMTHQLGT